jgi:tRNA threonylcarbamoyladenosine biosynthesis protein TsaB
MKTRTSLAMKYGKPADNDILKDNSKKMDDVKGIVCFAGPGSFTGLRIGLTVGNAMAYGLEVGIVATMGENWISDGINRLISGDTDKMALPEYGAEVHITKQRK